jgi:signal transduction histidine kinase/AmiR/NasT family two-component response regulator
MSATNLSSNKDVEAPHDDFYWLSRISDVSGLGIILFSQDMDLEFINKLARDYFEIPAHLFKRNASYNTLVTHMAKRGDFGAGDSQSFVAHIADILNNQKTAGDGKIAELKLTMPSGRRLLVRQKYDTDNRLLLTASDITKEERDSETLDIALDSGGAGFWYYNCETGEAALHADYLEKHLSRRHIERVRKEGFLPIMHPDDVKKARLVWDKGLKNGESWKHTCRILTGNGHSLWLRWHARPQLSDHGKVISFTCFFKDITQELETSDALRKAKESAEKSLKVKNDFLARLSHEVRTPMNGVIGIADALIHHHPDKSIQPKLELIQSSADKILRIVDETLDHTKLHADKLTLDSKQASPAKSVENVVKLWEHKALKNNISLSYAIDPSVPDMITFDHYRYEQCLNNLISNAVKFTPNGTIKVVLTLIEKEGHPPRLVLVVQDNGIGMTPDQQKQIFEAYTQADKSIARRFGGTGLGMTITKEIIELMGGSISLRSESGKGSVFALTLPIEEIKPKATKQQSEALVDQLLEKAMPEPSKYADLRILVTDDNATNHMVVSSLLESLVGEIHIASDGQQAIQVLETTPIDIVLMDIHMPVMDGIEATLAIRGRPESWSDVLIIALTADPQYQQRRLCKNIGMDDALAKPVKLVELLRAFDNVLAIENPTQNFQKSA